MALLSIDGIHVSFPFQPYEVQEKYMHKVVECLQKGFNGILESPTGTGKTLCLLCSSLAWLESCKAKQQFSFLQKSESGGLLSDMKLAMEKIAGMWDPGSNFMTPRIIYSSRTHSQLSQAIQELKRSNYRHIKSIVLGSRDQLCLHPEVSKAPNHTTKVHMCRAKINSKSCVYHMNYEDKIASKSDYQEASVLDIEDLVTLGKKNMVCPYYAARSLKSRADMIFTPYNYIIDPKSRRAHGIELQGNIVIFDEAHNIEGACEESMSFQLRSFDLALCLNELDQVIRMLQEFDENFSSSDTSAPDFNLTDLSILKVMFCELEEQLDKEVAEMTSKEVQEGGSTKPGDYLIQIFNKVELSSQKRDLVVDLLDKIIQFLTVKAGGGAFSSKGAGLQRFADLLSVMFSRAAADGCREGSFRQELTTKYRVYLQQETPNKGQGGADAWAAPVLGSKRKQAWKLDGWCFSPGLGMKELVERGVYSVILTSGTLSPLGPMIAELGISFPVQLENPHIIRDNQVFVAVVTKGPDGTRLNSSFQNRTNQSYVSSLGRTISNFCRMIPDGFLVFFPSYSVMRSNVASWQEHQGVWQTLSGLKPLFVEPQGKDAFQECIDKYYAVMQEADSKGATLLAVCRGKVSEGLDFADENARAVVITGLPFPPFMDPRVKMKMAYLDSTARETKGLSGRVWYNLQASRAVNQAIGRVIRHKDDFGAILLCDERFKDNQSQLSKWIQGRITVFHDFGPALRGLSNFYKGLALLPRRSKQKPTASGFQTGSSVYSCSNPNQNGVKQAATNQNTEQKCVETILEGYKSKTEASCSSKSGISIFDALETQSQELDSGQRFKPSLVEKHSAACYKGTDDVSTPSTSDRSASKKRKINFALRQAVNVENENSSSLVWKNYLSEVKLLLGVTEQYGRFCSSVKQFKTSKNVDTFAESLKNVFSSVPNKSKYLQTASLLVSAHDRGRFLSMSS